MAKIQRLYDVIKHFIAKPNQAAAGGSQISGAEISFIGFRDKNLSQLKYNSYTSLVLSVIAHQLQ